MKLGFVITNDKASYDAKEDGIFLFSFAKEAALNNQAKNATFWGNALHAVFARR